jgi:hypothetical protein
MKYRTQLILLLFVTAVCLPGCKKNEGCTDIDAANYDDGAESDNGTCRYSGQLVFWFGEETSSDMVDNGVNTLTYYVDGDVVGSDASSVFWTGAPDCGQGGSISVKMDLGDDKSRTYSYYVEGQSGFEHWSGLVTFEAQHCQTIELVW